MMGSLKIYQQALYFYRTEFKQYRRWNILSIREMYIIDTLCLEVGVGGMTAVLEQQESLSCWEVGEEPARRRKAEAVT